MFNKNPMSPEEMEKRKQERLEEKLDKELQKQALHQQMTLFEKMEAFLDEKENKRQNPSPAFKTRMMTITQTGVEVDLEGFNYFGIWCPQSETGKVFKSEWFGMSSNHTTGTGFNFYNFKDGMKLIAETESIFCVMILQNSKPL